MDNRYGKPKQLHDMFRIPVSLGCTVMVRNHSNKWGWITVKGVVIGLDGDRVNLQVTEYSRHTPEDTNRRPEALSPLASAVTVIQTPTRINIRAFI